MLPEVGCLCAGDPTKPCAYCALAEQIDYLHAEFGDHISDMPVFPGSDGTTLTKNTVVTLWRELGVAAGLSVEKEGRAVAGHSARVGGAQFLAAIGLDLYLIQLLARWESAIIMRYVTEAPLIALTQTT